MLKPNWVRLISKQITTTKKSKKKYRYIPKMYPGVLYFFSFLRRVYNNLLTDHLAKCEHIERVPHLFSY